MKYFHYLKIRLITRNEDEIHNLLTTLVELLDIDDVKKAINLEIDLDNETGIFIGSFWIKKEKIVRTFLTHILQNKDAKLDISENLEQMIDEDCYFYVRCVKESFPKIELTQSGNCVHCTFKVAAYPKKKELAVKVCRDFFAKIPYSNA